MSDSVEEQIASGVSGRDVSTRTQDKESQPAVTQRRGSMLYSLLSPFPEGWYFISTRQAVEKAKLIQKTWMGETILIWCDNNGRICVSESYGPHLGADLGPEGGGCIRDGRLLCPFHGYEFDTTGQCVATPFAPPPKTAKLRVYETQEINGLIFAWWGIGGRAPHWKLHTDPLDQTGWGNSQINTLRFAGHPQETTENVVDLAHLRYVHGYDNVNSALELALDGPCLEARFDFKRVRRIAKVANLTFQCSARARVFGLGYSFVEVHEQSIGMDLRLWVLATPVDGTLIDLTLVSQVKEIRKPKRMFAGLGFLPTRMRAPIMNRFMRPSSGKTFCRTWSSGAASSTGRARAFAVPTARSCPSGPTAPSSTWTRTTRLAPFLEARRQQRSALHLPEPPSVHDAPVVVEPPLCFGVLEVVVRADLSCGGEPGN